jgi:hypothetical protein
LWSVSDEFFFFASFWNVATEKRQLMMMMMMMPRPGVCLCVCVCTVVVLVATGTEFRSAYFPLHSRVSTNKH